jgi:hypothetical protein
MIPAFLAFSCDRVVYPCLVSLCAVANTVSECARDIVIECLILQQVVSINAFGALEES